MLRENAGKIVEAIRWDSELGGDGNDETLGDGYRKRSAKRIINCVRPMRLALIFFYCHYCPASDKERDIVVDF